MKIGIIIRFYFYRVLLHKIKEGMIFPSHHLWGSDYLIEKGYILEEIDPNSVKQTKGILGRLFSSNLRQQNLIYKKKVDIVYSPFFFDCYWLAFLRILRLNKKPLITIAQDTWNTKYCDSVKEKICFKWFRFLAKYGTDRLLFISPNVLNKTNNYFDNNKTFALYHWGVDLSYFDSFLKVQKNFSLNQYAYVTGGSNRDFEIIINAARNIPNVNIIIQSSKKSTKSIEKSSIPQNMKIITDCKEEFELLQGYYDSFCVLVPLLKDTGSMTGITVVFEAMAMGKPIISTRSNYYPFDIEAEGIGIYVDYGDRCSWEKAIMYLYNNPQIAKEMGEKGKKLVQTNFNYKLFCNELENHIRSLFS